MVTCRPSSSTDRQRSHVIDVLLRYHVLVVVDVSIRSSNALHCRYVIIDSYTGARSVLMRCYSLSIIRLRNDGRGTTHHRRSRIQRFQRLLLGSWNPLDHSQLCVQLHPWTHLLHPHQRGRFNSIATKDCGSFSNRISNYEHHLRYHCAQDVGPGRLEFGQQERVCFRESGNASISSTINNPKLTMDRS